MPALSAKPSTPQSPAAKHLALSGDRLVSVSELQSTQHPKQDSTQNGGKREDPYLPGLGANPESNSGGFHDQTLAQATQIPGVISAGPHEFGGPLEKPGQLVG